MVYDNFSKFVIAWKVTTEIGGISTVNLLDQARKCVLEIGLSGESKVMMDGGPENNNHKVLQFITSKSLTRLLARVDVHYSNSMVESLFRGLKSNFLNSEELKSKSDVEQKVNFYFSEYNDKIPRPQFNGATPREKILNLWSDLDTKKLKESMMRAQANRKKVFRSRTCRACQDKETQIISEK